MKRVVVIGGGNGSALCLEALKKQINIFELSAVVSMSDSGGSSGRLRKELGTLPPGDIMRAILSLSKYDYKMLREVFYKPRFSKLGKLDTHNLGNLFLVLTSKFCGNFLHALDALAHSVKAVGKVYPVTLESVDLEAELSNGDIIHTEFFIDNPEYNRGWKIKRVWLYPDCKAYKKAVEAIKQANYIVLSPGSLYTSLIATLLPRGIKKAIFESKAKLIYVAGNAYRLDGETGPERLSELVFQLERYLPRKIDIILHNNHKPDKKQKMFYKNHKWGVLEFDLKNLSGRNVKSLDFEDEEGGSSPEKLSTILQKIICSNKF